MISSRAFRLATISLTCLVAMPASSALGATPRPSITSIAPLKLAVGDMLTIKGKNFRPGKRTNTVLFKSDRSPAISVKAAEASKTRMKVIVPASLGKYLTVVGGVKQPTRFRVKILAKRFGKSFTIVAKSPLIGPANVSPADGTPGGPGATTGTPNSASATTTPATVTPPPPPDCDADGIADSADGDDDNDGLSDALEATIKTAPCVRDTDFDGNEDAFEYFSAIDLNQNPSFAPTPYPIKRPYPNPLDAGDADTDFDGDGLSGSQEALLWAKFGNRALPLNYSDGTKFSGVPVPAPTDPALVHLNIPTASDTLRDAFELSDDEKDADVDRLGNWDEVNGRMRPGFWPANDKEEKQFSPFYEHGLKMYLQPNFLDPDSDGDGILDGDDDQDHDDRNNVSELNRGPLMVHPYNPCLPSYTSRTCPRYIEEGDTKYAPYTFEPMPPDPVPYPWPALP